MPIGKTVINFGKRKQTIQKEGFVYECVFYQ